MKIRKLLEAEMEYDEQGFQKVPDDISDNPPPKSANKQQSSSIEIENTIEQKLKENKKYTDIDKDIKSWVDACIREKGNQ